MACPNNNSSVHHTRWMLFVCHLTKRYSRDTPTSSLQMKTISLLQMLVRSEKAYPGVDRAWLGGGTSNSSVSHNPAIASVELKIEDHPSMQVEDDGSETAEGRTGLFVVFNLGAILRMSS